MTTNIVAPGVVRLEPLSTRTSTVVLCGDPERIRDTVPASIYEDNLVELLPSGNELRSYADRHSPADVCVIVTPLPDGPTLPIARVLKARGWSHVTVLSSKADARAVYSSLSSGVRSVLVNRDVEQGPAPAMRDGLRLSDRELEVLRMVANGMTNRCIGEELGLSALTVKSHLARIARKFGCGDRAQMVAEAIRAGYIH